MFCSLAYMNFVTKLRFLWIFAPGGLLSYEALQTQNTSKLIKLNDLIANLVNDSLKYLITWLNIKQDNNSDPKAKGMGINYCDEAMCYKGCR